MDIWRTIKFNLNQILAIVEKHIRIKLRFKLNLFMGYFQPLIQILLPLIIMNAIFDLNEEFGPWNRETYIIYVFIGYTVILFRNIINYMPGEFVQEKYWKTLSALMVAPFNKFNLLFGIMIAHLLIVFIPFVIFLCICVILFPISVVTLIFVLLLAFAILIIFSGIALIVGVFAISKENVRKILTTALGLIFFVSCASYPYEIFPPYLQSLISINPIYYIIDILRLSWIENDIIFTVTNHPIHFLIILSLLISLPTIGILMFNYIFKKYGIVGY
ncbi:MAG: ABC transporter permease [Candidatus Hodarchaeota archaeon]